MPTFTYLNNRSGAKVAADFERLMKTGDVAKLTPGLYDALTMHGGFIAHFDINGFRATFDGKLTELLRGEMDPLTDPDRFTWPALEDSGYTDGLSAGDVMRMIARIGARYAGTVKLREQEEQRAAEVDTLRVLAERHGYLLVDDDGQDISTDRAAGRAWNATALVRCNSHRAREKMLRLVGRDQAQALYSLRRDVGTGGAYRIPAELAPAAKQITGVTGFRDGPDLHDCWPSPSVQELLSAS